MRILREALPWIEIHRTPRSDGVFQWRVFALTSATVLYELGGHSAPLT